VLIVDKATPDQVLAAIQGYGGTIVSSSLSAEAQAKLQAALSSTPGTPVSAAAAAPISV
jgi:uncharacterized membrane protein